MAFILCCLGEGRSSGLYSLPSRRGGAPAVFILCCLGEGRSSGLYSLLSRRGVLQWPLFSAVSARGAPVAFILCCLGEGVLQRSLFFALSAPCLCPLCPALSDETRVLRSKQPQ